jgi:hypothetical protein
MFIVERFLKVLLIDNKKERQVQNRIEAVAAAVLLVNDE